MTVVDAAEVAALAGQLGYPASAQQIEDRFRGLSREVDSSVFVAQGEDGRLAGWIHVLERRFLELDRYAEIAGLVVNAGARRSGVGRALIAAAEEWAREHGCVMVRVRSNMKRVEARPFYERMGYRVVKSQHVFERAVRTGPKCGGDEGDDVAPRPRGRRRRDVITGAGWRALRSGDGA